MDFALLASRLRSVALGAFVFVVLVAAGWAAARAHATLAIAMPALVALAALAWTHRGVFVGIMVLAAMDGIPFIDTTHDVRAHIAGQDLAILGLLAAAVVWVATQRSTGPPKRVIRLLGWCGMALLAWLVLTIIRTVGNGDSSILGAVKYGRDFLYFSLLLLVLPRVRFSSREITALLGLLATALCLFSVGQIVTTTGIAHPQWLVHTTASTVANQTFGVARVYSPMNDLLLAGLVASIGALMFMRSGRGRLVALPMTALLLTSFILQLARARWIGLVVSLLVVCLWLLFRGDPRVTSVLRKRLAILAGLLSGVGAIAVWTAPSAIVTGPFAQRVASILTDLTASKGSVGVRQYVIGILSRLLAGRWFFGLGLIPPSSHSYSGLPYGSLRDPDVGVFGALVTIGIIGAALIYLPLIIVLVHVLRRSRRNEAAPYAWLRYCGALWIVATLASSITIVTLFSVGGLAMSAVIVALLVQPNVSGLDTATVAVDDRREQDVASHRVALETG